MYNLLVSGGLDTWKRTVANWEMGRYLEYTVDRLKDRFGRLDDEVINTLTSIPTLFLYEIGRDQPGRVGWIETIDVRQAILRLNFKFDSALPPIEQNAIRRLSVELDIAELEFGRTHWAIKDVDLLAVLRSAGVLRLPPAVLPNRKVVLIACRVLRSLSHAAFDQMLMEIGIGEIDAGREKGSLLARSNALAKYTIDHLDRPTAEGEPLAIAVVRHAAEFDETRLGIQLGGVTEEMRTFLRDAIRKNGLANDDLVAAQGRVLPPYTKAAVHETESISDSVEGAIMPRRKTGKVFIVHGREDGPKYEIAHFLTQIGLEPVILHERPNGGRTLISKFQEESGDIEFAVVLMTPDDSGGLAGGAQSPRARQNVIFELGFFIGKLGPAKVCALVAGAIEKPSDFEAVVYIEYGPKTSWKVELARELRHAGIQFDPNKVF